MQSIATVKRRWETNARFYEAHIESDMFGNVVLEKVWGSLHSHRGGHQVVAVGAEECQRGLFVIEKERSRRGYREVFVNGVSASAICQL